MVVWHGINEKINEDNAVLARNDRFLSIPTLVLIALRSARRAEDLEDPRL